ncbi:MAG: CapA family protein, partial [Oscillospiraceae bacterium]|nr:CapA family protein [Oscillospiraceae bacterium]
TLCAFSVGNFISAQNSGANLVSGILEFNVTFTDKSEAPVISDIRLTPIVTHYDYGYANLRLYKLSDYTPELAAAHGVRQYSSFGYDYIINVLRNAIDEEYLALP